MKGMIVSAAALLLAVTCTTTRNNVLANEGEEILTERQQEALSQFSEDLHNWLEHRASLEGTGFSPLSLMDPPGGDVVITPGNPDNGYPGGPGDDPVPVPPVDPGMGTDYGSTGGFDFSTYTRKSGAADIIAMESFYQTMMFYGVVHIIERKGTQKVFKIVQSKNGYFRNVTTLDVAFALRTFSLYIQALLCNDPSQTNVGKMLGQVKWEDIGLRFKYDMAWAILGNLLPKTPNQIMKLGTRWKALSQLLSTIPTLSNQMGAEKTSELRTWAASITDVVSILSKLNGLMCFVDVRPDPREEIKKRQVVKALLELDKRQTDRYNDLKDIVDQIEAEGKQAKVDAIKTSAPATSTANP